MDLKSSAFCPVSDKKVNERVARINGAFTVLLLIYYGLTQSIFPVIFLALDFLLRASAYSKYSLIGLSSQGIARYLSLSGNSINAGPKIFAARIGMVISLLILVFASFGASVPALVLTGMLGLFSFLEAVFGICVACEIYPVVYRLLYRTRFQGL